MFQRIVAHLAKLRTVDVTIQRTARKILAQSIQSSWKAYEGSAVCNELWFANVRYSDRYSEILEKLPNEYRQAAMSYFPVLNSLQEPKTVLLTLPLIGSIAIAALSTSALKRFRDFKGFTYCTLIP